MKDLSRPSIDDFINQHPEYAGKAEFQNIGDRDGIWKQKRGNSAIYVCQYCNHISDADIQASYWIALKRFCLDLVDSSGRREGERIGLGTLSERHLQNRLVTDLRLDRV